MAAPTLSALVAAFVSTRSPGWLVLDTPEVLASAVKAAQFYSGYGPIRSIDATLGAVGDLSLINGDLVLTPGEWSCVSPLFFLYVEFEQAQRLESSRANGLDPFGRGTDAIKADVDKAEEQMSKRSFVFPVQIIGVCGDDTLPPSIAAYSMPGCCWSPCPPPALPC